MTQKIELGHFWPLTVYLETRGGLPGPPDATHDVVGSKRGYYSVP